MNPAKQPLHLGFCEPPKMNPPGETNGFYMSFYGINKIKSPMEWIPREVSQTA